MWADLQKQYGDSVEFRDYDRDTPEGRKYADEKRLFSQPGFVVYDAKGNETYRGLGPSTRSGVIDLVKKAAEGD